MKNFVRVFLLINLQALLMACTQLPVENTATSRKLTILHTNDHHGRFWHNDEGEYGMAARKTLLDQLRAKAQANGSEVLLLSGGDINTGIPESDMQLAEPDFKAMAMLGYDAMALGNHEFDNPVSVLAKQQEWAGFPFLSANIYHKNSNERAYQPYKMFDKNGLKIAVIGLTTTDTAKIGNPEYISHLEFRDPSQTTRLLIDDIRQSEQPDIIIAVTHMGHFSDAKHGINAPGDITLARNLKHGQLAMIIGGHSQEPVCMTAINVNNDNFSPGDECVPDKQNGTWIMQAHEWGKYVGKAEFEYANNELTLVDYQLIPVNMKKTIVGDDGHRTEVFAQNEIEKDAELYQFLSAYQQNGDTVLSTPIAQISGDLMGDRAIVRYQQTNLGRLIAAAQMAKVDADFGIISSGGIRSSIKSGAVTYKHVLSVHPFKNRLTYVDMIGAELQKYIETIAKFPPDSGAYTQYYGIEFVLLNNQVSAIYIQNKPIDLDKTYRFSINSYNAAGGDGYPVLVNHKGYVATSFIDADVLKEYLMQNSPVDSKAFEPTKH